LAGNGEWPSGTWLENVQVKEHECIDEKNDSAHDYKDLEGLKDIYVENKKMKQICTRVHT